MGYEYTVIPAPTRGEKVRGAKSPAERFSAAMAGALNRMAAEGWDYVRAETLPSEERSGLTSRATVWMNVLVFRRALARPEAPAQVAAAEPAPSPVAAAPVAAAPAATPAPEPPAGPPFSQPMRLAEPAN